MRRRSFLALTASFALAPLARPTTAQTPVAAYANQELLALLRLLPDDPVGETGIRYANYARQLAALGIAEIGTEVEPDTWGAAMGTSMLIPNALLVPMEPMWREGLGFDLRDVGQMVGCGSILLLTGQFDGASLTTAWEAGGYVPTKTEGITWHTLGEDNVVFDPDFPLSDYHLGALSHLALLDGGIVVGTAERADMEQVLALHAGSGASLADGPAGALAAAPTDLAVGWIVDGTALIAVGDSLAGMANNPNVPPDVRERIATHVAEMNAEMAEEAPRMPPIALALVGATAGAAIPLSEEAFPEGPKGHAIAVVVPVDAADVEVVAETATRRLTTLEIPGLDLDVGGGRPYAEVFPGMMVESTPNGAVVVDLEPAPDVSASRLIDLQERGLLSFLVWGG